MKRCIAFLLIMVLAFTIFPPFSALAATNSMSYTEKDLEDDNTFTPAIHTTIGRGDEGSNSYIGQSFIADGNPITGCRLYLRVGDTATMTIQIRTSLTGGNESILYSGNFPLVSNPHNITGFWDFEFTRAVPVEKNKTYYLVAWCDVYHSYCIAGITQYICNNLVNRSYRKADNATTWTQYTNNKSFGYEILTDPNAEVKGYPFQADNDTLMIHDAEEYFCFSRTEPGTTVTLSGNQITQGSYSLTTVGSAPDKNGSMLTTYVDFYKQTDLSAYKYFYTDVHLNQEITTDATLLLSYSDESGNGKQFSYPLTNKQKGWHRIAFTQEECENIGNGSLKNAKTVTIQLLGKQYPENLALSFDNIRAAKKELTSFSSTYYTEEELNQPIEIPDEDYIGKPDEPSGTKPEITYGDLNNDKNINAKDALMILQAAVLKIRLSENQVIAGNVDGNNALNAVDALWVLKYAVKKADRFPVQDNPPVDDETITCTDFEITTQGLAPNTIYQINKSVIANNTRDGMPHDIARLISSLQGLVNRDAQKNKIALVIVDNYTDTWVSYIQENDIMLDELTNVVKIPTITAFLNTFKNQLMDCGLVLWDPKVPSTANVAETICGLDGYLPVKYLEEDGSFYNTLMEMGIPVKLSLVDKFKGQGMIPGTSILSTGSVKCDPYLWALDKYSSRCTPDLLVYTPDGASATVGNIIYEQDIHSKSLDYNRSYGYDYGISKKAFFFDLSPLDVEAPCDDPTQIVGTDRQTLIEILTNRYYRAGGAFGEVSGFPPWWIKYGSHNGWGSVADTSLEAAFTDLISEYNGFMDADGSITNSSLYAQFTLDDHYESIGNSKPVTEKFDKNTMYLYMYTGDYDSSGWALEHMYKAYNDKERGSIPITWSVNPGLSTRIPMFLDYLYKNQTENDYFNASDSGIGYIRPHGLFKAESNRTLPDGDKEFIRISKKYFNQFDMDSVGFIIGRLSDNVCRTYNQIAPVGSNTNDVSWTPAVYDNTPYMRIKNGIGDPATTDAAMATAVADMYEFSDGLRAYNVAGYRTIKFHASHLKKTQEAFITYAAEKDPDTTYKFVDYKTYFAMMREGASGKYTF